MSGTNSGTSATYDIELGQTYTREGNPANLTISLALDAYVFTSAAGGLFSSGDGYARGLAQSNNVGYGLAVAQSLSASTGPPVEDEFYAEASAADNFSQSYDARARLKGYTDAHSAGPVGEGHADVQYAHVAYSAP